MQHDKNCNALIGENKDCDCSATRELYYIRDSRVIIGNCVVWWRVGGAGYTCNLKEAWKVPKYKLYQFDRRTDIAHKVDDIDKLTILHVDFQSLR